jgi:hypothetical protein
VRNGAIFGTPKRNRQRTDFSAAPRESAHSCFRVTCEYPRSQADTSLENLLNVLSSQDKMASNQVASSYDVVLMKPLPRTYADRVVAKESC